MKNKFNITKNYDNDKLFDKLGMMRLRESYMRDEELSPQDRYEYVAREFASDENHAQRLYDYASKHWVSFATPILSYGRSNKGLPISCFLTYLSDSAEGLVDTLSETNWLSMIGGGVGIGVGIRASDEKSTGIMPHMKTYDACSLAYQQSKTRRGSYAAYLRVDHPDILVFLEMRKPTGDQNMKALNMHHGVVIPDSFMEIIEKSMLDGNFDDSWELKQPHTGAVVETVSARDIWQRILEIRMQTGEPYILFIDTANELLPKYQKDLGLEIRQSNICVAPETPILTSKGYHEIASLENTFVDVWNGVEWSNVEIKKTGTGVELVTVNFSDGSSIDCTPEHKFYVQKEPGKPSVEVKAKELQAHQKMEKFTLPDAFDSGSGIEGIDYYSQGFYSGEDNTELEQSQFDETKCVILDKLFVPINDTVENKISWIAGYINADNSIVDSPNGQNIQIVNSNKTFLHNIKLMLQTLGVSSDINFCQELWMLDVNYVGVSKLLSLGMLTNRLIFQKEHETQDNTENFVYVTSVEYSGRISDTYCFTEHKRHRGTFNGIVTGQCTEILLPTDENRTAVCCLSSLNLRYYDDWKNNKQLIPDLMEMLDNVLDRFISDAPPPVSKAVFSAMRERSIGIGALGFHTYLQIKGIAFESAMAKSVNNAIFKNIKTQIDAANEKMGVEKGSCPDAIEGGHDKPRRFTKTMAIAPTASTSIIMGNISPSIEPIRANAYRQDTLSGSFINKNKILDELIIKKCEENSELNYDKIWNSIINRDGSIQHLDMFDENEKAIFKTAHEIDQRWIIEHASDRQKYIDQTQSVNLFFLPNVHVKYLHAVHFMAWKHKLPTLYYTRSTKLKKADNISEQIERKVIEEVTASGLVAGDECLACE